MAEAEKSPSEQAEEIQKLIDDAQDSLTQAKWALETLTQRLKASSSGDEGGSATG